MKIQAISILFFKFQYKRRAPGDTSRVGRSTITVGRRSRRQRTLGWREASAAWVTLPTDGEVGGQPDQSRYTPGDATAWGCRAGDPFRGHRSAATSCSQGELLESKLVCSFFKLEWNRDFFRSTDLAGSLGMRDRTRTSHTTLAFHTPQTHTHSYAIMLKQVLT